MNEAAKMVVLRTCTLCRDEFEVPAGGRTPPTCPDCRTARMPKAPDNGNPPRREAVVLARPDTDRDTKPESSLIAAAPQASFDAAIQALRAERAKLECRVDGLRAELEAAAARLDKVNGVEVALLDLRGTA